MQSCCLLSSARCADDVQTMCGRHMSSSSEISPKVSLSCRPHEISTPKIFPLKEQTALLKMQEYYCLHHGGINHEHLISCRGLRLSFSHSGHRFRAMGLSSLSRNSYSPLCLVSATLASALEFNPPFTNQTQSRKNL